MFCISFFKNFYDLFHTFLSFWPNIVHKECFTYVCMNVCIQDMTNTNTVQIIKIIEVPYLYLPCTHSISVPLKLVWMLHIKFCTKHNLNPFLLFPRTQVPHSSELPIWHDGTVACSIKIVLQYMKHIWSVDKALTAQKICIFKRHLIVGLCNEIYKNSFWEPSFHTSVRNGRFIFYI
jgi:hypothetical protein